MSWKKRPESPELDEEQNEQLRKHFEGMSTKKLEKALQQTVEDAERDRGPYPKGGAPANTQRAFNTIREILERRRGGSGPESR